MCVSAHTYVQTTHLVVDAWVVDVLTLWAEDLDGAGARQVAGADRQAGLAVTQHPEWKAAAATEGGRGRSKQVMLTRQDHAFTCRRQWYIISTSKLPLPPPQPSHGLSSLLPLNSPLQYACSQPYVCSHTQCVWSHPPRPTQAAPEHTQHTTQPHPLTWGSAQSRSF